MTAALTPLVVYFDPLRDSVVLPVGLRSSCMSPRRWSSLLAPVMATVIHVTTHATVEVLEYRRTNLEHNHEVCLVEVRMWYFAPFVSLGAAFYGLR